MALYQKYRPKTLEEIWGNKSTVKAVEKVLSKDRKDIPHAFLFTGPSGCGKTTFGRIIARELGCQGRDYVEIDTADFRGIDTVRNIRKNMKLMPSSKSECRVYLLDEVHMLGRGGDSSKNEAQNALLKSLEDAPDHVYFILCTTDPQMLIKTIKSRCVSFQVSPLSKREIVEGLSKICSKEKKRVKKPILEKIAVSSMGHVRAAINTLDKIIDLDPEEQETQIQKAEAQEAETIELCRVLLKKGSWKTVSSILSRLEAEPESIRYAVAGYARAVCMKKNDEAAFDLLNLFTSRRYIDKFELTALCMAHVNGYGLWDNAI